MQLGFDVHNTMREPDLAILDPVQDVRYIGVLNGQNNGKNHGFVFQIA
jgi:hypothetical protein